MDILNNSKIEHTEMPLELGDLPQPKIIEVEDLEDLLQMAVSRSNGDLELYHLERNSEHLYFVWIVIHDFYSLNGLPLVIFVRKSEKPTRFIKFRPDLGTIHFVDKIEEASAAYIKIIKIKNLPFCLDLSLKV
jgi:hypothetical protein